MPITFQSLGKKLDRLVLAPREKREVKTLIVIKKKQYDREIFPRVSIESSRERS